MIEKVEEYERKILASVGRRKEAKKEQRKRR